MTSLTEISWPDTPFSLNVEGAESSLDRLVLVGRRGSEAHGTYVPSTDPDSIDDRDVMGVVVPPRDYYLGMKKWEGAESIKGEWDVVLYEVRKFAGLLGRQNPNVLSMLWLEPEDYLHVGPVGQKLLDHRDLFRSRRAASDAFVGYARGQLKRMTHYKFEGYMGAKRKELVDRHGYDTKNAAHLVRLLHTGLEYLRTGRLQVRRTWDVDVILKIKRGGWSLHEVRDYADRKFEEFKEVYDESPLPPVVNWEAINRLVVECVELGGGRWA